MFKSSIVALRLPASLSSVRSSSTFISTSLRSATKVAVASTSLSQSLVARNSASIQISPITKRAFSQSPVSRFSPSSAAMSHNVEKITNADDFRAKVLNSTEPSIVDCSATWCGPCKAISPVFQRLSNNPDFQNAKFYEIDVDELSDIAAELGVRAMPTFMFFKNGQKVNEVVGANPPALENAVKTHVA